MSVWVWLAIGLLGWLALSTVLGLFIAQILRRVSSDVIEPPGWNAPVSPLRARDASKSLTVRS